MTLRSCLASLAMTTLISPTAADLPRLVRIERSFPPHHRYSEDDFRRCLRRRQFETMIFTAAGEDIAYAIVDRHGGSDADAVFLESLCIAPGRIGRGHGRQVMGLIEARYREAVELQALPNVAPFYERLGYIEVPGRRHGRRRFFRKEGRLWLAAMPRAGWPNSATPNRRHGEPAPCQSGHAPPPLPRR